MNDSLYCGRRLHTLNIVDESTRKSLNLEVDTLLLAERVVRVLDRLGQQRGLAKQLRVDNGLRLNYWTGVKNMRLKLCIYNLVSHSKNALRFIE